ncbi:MAG: trigger factor [Acidimicrobiales bacterium]
MKTSVEPLEGNKVKLSVEVEEGEFDKALDTVFRQLAREVRVKGFRPGKAPRRLLEAQVGPGYAREQALRDALPQYYGDAVREHEVDAIAAPEINITSGEMEGAVAFDAVVEVRPQILVPGYGGLRVTLPRPTATDDEVDAQIQRLQDQGGELQAVDRPAAKGDHVTISLNGTRGGEPVAGLSADDYLYEVGSALIAPELDEQLRGAKVGDVLQFSATPTGTDDGPVDFRVLVKDIKEKLLPEPDDEWANEVSEFDTVEELRADIANRVTTMRRLQANLELRENTIGALVKLVEEDPPEPLVQAELRNRFEDLAARLSSQGVTAEQWLQMTGRTEEQVVEELRTIARRGVKADLALRAVAEAEAIEVTDDDLDEEFAKLAEQLHQRPAKVRQQFERSGTIGAVRSDIRKRKALDWLVEQVEIVDGDGQPIERADLEIPDSSGDTVEDDSGAEAQTEAPPEAADVGDNEQ